MKVDLVPCVMFSFSDEAEFSCDACDLNFPSNMLKMRHCNSSKCLANQKKAVKPCAGMSLVH